jgi:hypothetical protein
LTMFAQLSGFRLRRSAGHGRKFCVAGIEIGDELNENNEGGK